MKTRYRYEEVALTPEEAKQRRDHEIDYAESRVERLREELKDAEVFLAALSVQPLETHRTVQTEVYPGEPGYDELPNVFSPANYQGGFKRVNK